MATAREPGDGEPDRVRSAPAGASPLGAPPLAEVADRLVVPDDAGSLHRDAVALARERRWATRDARGPGRFLRQVTSRLLRTRRWQRYGLSGPLLVLVLLVVGAVGALMTALAPSSPPRVAPAALATDPAAPPGEVGGLLPSGSVRVGTGGGEEVRLRSPRLRPGVLALVPDRCGCDDAVRAAVDGSLSYGLTLRVVTASSTDPDGAEARRLAAGPARGLVPLGVDLDDRLHLAYAPVGLTLVLVRPDGTVDAVLRGVGEDDRLEPALQRLVGRTPPT